MPVVLVTDIWDVKGAEPGEMVPTVPVVGPIIVPSFHC